MYANTVVAPQDSPEILELLAPPSNRARPLHLVSPVSRAPFKTNEDTAIHFPCETLESGGKRRRRVMGLCRRAIALDYRRIRSAS